MQNRFLTSVLAGLIALGLGAACAKKDEGGDKGKDKQAEAPQPPPSSMGDQPGEPPPGAGQSQVPTENAGSHILIPYVGARSAKPDVTRTKEEAKKFAADLLNEIKKDPKKFEDLARQHSSCPSGKMKGGSLGKWKPGRMVREFDEAIAKISYDEVTGPVETAFGFHLIRREDPTKVSR